MINADFFTKLDAMALALKRHAAGRYQGEQKTSYAGDGLTFKDFSPYVLGDDFRKIDWKVFARTRELFVRRYEADKNLTIHILIDASGSMSYRSSPRDMSKFEYASHMALGIAHIGQKNHERIELSLFNQHITPLKLQNQSLHIKHLVSRIQGVKPEGEGDFHTLFTEYKSRVKTKSLIFIVSDFLYSPTVLKSIYSQFPKSQVYLVQVLHKDEITLPFEGDTKFINPEKHSESIKAYVTKSLQKNYQKELLKHTIAIKQSCGPNTKYIQLNTGANPVASFMQVWQSL